jgi:ADP-heptose:LPS heptosyltransferase
VGIGDEIMALGRAEKLFQETGRQVCIVNEIGRPRFHDAWKHNPAWNPASSQALVDCAGNRPYIKHWLNRKIIFNLDYSPIAGKIHLTEDELAFPVPSNDYLVISPYLKDTASKNKSWGEERYIELLKKIKMPVFQLIQNKTDRVIEGARPIHTPHFRNAARVISSAKLVICNEGGAHHIAASMGTKAVVYFGSFIPPSVTGYKFHKNLSVESGCGYCGDWNTCLHCEAAKKQITIDMFLNAINEALEEK